jgi:hypothetical protein
MVLTSVNSGTGFAVTAPNSAGISWPGGSSQTITWEVSGSNLAPINTANVRILLSTNGGTTFPIVLTSSTANDGSEVVEIPSNAGTTQGRIMIEAVGNIFFDISNFNFQITADTTPPSSSATAPDITTGGGTTQTITVVYTDNSAINASSLGNGDIEVLAPDSSVLSATLVSQSSITNTSPITATYEIAAPGGTWDSADNGSYTIRVVANEVSDAAGNFVAPGNVGSFNVSISSMNLPGDFNDDGLLDCLDVNALTMAIAAGGKDLSYDLTNDSLLNLDDLDEWVLRLKGTRYGDANLDLTVDQGDFADWDANKFTSNTAWCTADFNADGVTDGTDFGIWNENRGLGIGRGGAPIVTAPDYRTQRSNGILRPRRTSAVEVDVVMAETSAQADQPRRHRSEVSSANRRSSYVPTFARGESRSSNDVMGTRYRITARLTERVFAIWQ